MRHLRAFKAPIAALTVTSLTNAVRSEEEEHSHSHAPSTSSNIEFFGLFLDKQSQNTLQKHFSLSNPSKQDAPLYAVIQFRPSDQEKEKLAAVLGEKAVIQVEGYVKDSESQAILISLKTPLEEQLKPIADMDKRLHIVLSSTFGTDGFNVGHSSVLMERLQASGILDRLSESETVQTQLSEHHSQSFPVYNPFPATDIVLEKLAISDLSGTFCLSSKYDFEKESCTKKGECGFCTFMRNGPCGTEFTAWEKCLDASKAAGEDFIAKCGSETLQMRDCIEEHPDYYRALNENETESGEAQDSDAKAA